MDAIIIAFASGKGGTGKSAVSVLVGGALAAQGKKVVLIELSHGLRSVDIMAGVSELAVFDLADVLGGHTPPAKAMVASPLYEGLSVMPSAHSGAGVVALDNLRALCSRLRPHFDYILLDVATGFGDEFRLACGVAHRMVMVQTPDPVALRDGRALADQVDAGQTQLRLVLNRVEPKRVLADGLLEDLDEAIDTMGVQLLGVVPESPVLQKAVLGGTALPPKSREAEVFAAIARRILGEDVPLLVR